MKIATKIVALVTSVVIFASIGIVSATWYYSGNTVDPEYESVEIDMGNNWETTNLLLAAIIEALNDDDSDLNYNIDYRVSGHSVWDSIPILGGFISSMIGDGKRTYYGSMDPQTDTTYSLGWITYNISLKKESIIDDDSSNLSYIIETSTDISGNAIYYLYICDTYLGTTSGNPTVPIGANIYHIYRTMLHTNSLGEWEAVDGETMIEGYAPSCWYETMQENTTITRYYMPSFDIFKWTAGTRGSVIDYAIWTFDGDSPTVTASSESTPVYYQMQTAGKTYYYTYDKTTGNASGTFYYYGISSSGDSSVYNYYYSNSGSGSSTHSYAYNAEGSYTITASDSNVSIIVYSDSSLGTVVASNFNGNVITGDSVTFTASEATTYYIQVYGATEFTLNVELTG